MAANISSVLWTLQQSFEDALKWLITYSKHFEKNWEDLSEHILVKLGPDVSF